MKKLGIVLGLGLLGVTSLFADYQLTLIDKDGTETSKCIKSYSFSNNLESLAKKNSVGLKDVYSKEEIMTNKVYLGKPVYRKIIDIDFDSSSATFTKPVTIQITFDNVDTFFIKDGFITQVQNGKEYVYNSHRFNYKGTTYYYFRTINNKLELRVFNKEFVKASAILEYTKTSDIVNSASNTFKSYLHYVPSSSENEDVTTVDLEDKGVKFLKGYTYNFETDSCTTN